ncbi:glycosyltransferase [Vibrio breoganii]
MKKLFIITTVPMTLSTILKGQPHHLNKHYDVTIVSSKSDELKECAVREGVTSLGVTMNRDITVIRDIFSIIKMIVILLKHKPDIIHSYTPKAGLVSMISGFVCRTPIRVHTFTGLIFPTSIGFKKKVLKLVDKIICLCATNIVPEGEGVRHDLINSSITNKDLKIIGNGNISGVDLEYFNPSIARSIKDLNIEERTIDGKFVFCFIGRLTPDKGIGELVESFCTLDSNCVLLLGGSMDDRNPLDAILLKKICSNPRIVLLGFLNDIRPLLYHSSVLVLPSYREGFPNVLLEAGAMKVPCITTDVNGCNEIIKTGFNGWVVQPRNSYDLLKAMRDSMQCESLTIYRENGRSFVEKYYEKKEYLTKLDFFYSALIHNNL